MPCCSGVPCARCARRPFFWVGRPDDPIIQQQPNHQQQTTAGELTREDMAMPTTSVGGAAAGTAGAAVAGGGKGMYVGLVWVGYVGLGGGLRLNYYKHTRTGNAMF